MNLSKGAHEFLEEKAEESQKLKMYFSKNICESSGVNFKHIDCPFKSDSILII